MKKEIRLSRIISKSRSKALRRFRMLHGKQKIKRIYKGTHRKKSIFGIYWFFKFKCYRNSLVKMYYAVTIKRNTPTPFAEFRTFTFTQEKKSKAKILNQVLTTTQKYFPSVAYALKHEDITAEITGEEIEEIDEDELEQSFKTTGWKKLEWNRIYRYVCFFDRYGKIKKDYNDRFISIMIGEKLEKRFGKAGFKVKHK